MRRTARNARRTSNEHQARPAFENLEGRRLLSGAHAHARAQGLAAAVAGPLGFSHNDTQFRYATPSGGRALIKIVGIGNLAGTTVAPNGALELQYGATNAYSKIVGKVHGGGGRAPLASLVNSQLVQAGRGGSLSGVGGNPLASVLMSSFDLVSGGTVNLTPGVGNVVLHSIGPNTQMNLRTLPPPPMYRILPSNPGNTAGNVPSSLYGLQPPESTSTGFGSGTGSGFGTGTSTSTSGSGNFQGATTPPNTLVAGQTTTITSPQGTALSYASTGNRSQVLTAATGSFTAQENLTEPLYPGQKDSGQHPAAPGLILKADTINGAPANNVNLLYDAKLFGYDPVTGNLVRFDLNLDSGSGTVDPTFAPIAVPGHPSVTGVSLVPNNGGELVLVASGTTVYAYNAVTGAPAGSFTAPNAINTIATTDGATVLGSYQTNQLQMIDVPASLQIGTEQPIGAARPFTPASQVTLLGGASGVAGSTSLYAAVAAHLSTLQPTQTQLGIQTLGTAQVIANTKGDGSSSIFNQFSPSGPTALSEFGNKITVQPDPLKPNQVGGALGSVDGSIALVAGASQGENLINLYNPTTLASRGTIKLTYPDQLAALSGTFRADLGGAAVIDVQGNIQSVRGRTARGLVLNDTGNLALVKFNSVANSQIIGQPISHLKIRRRTNSTFFSTARLVGHRNDVITPSNLQQIGPLARINP